ncbi:hypothetical protein AS156_26785 [Bradyrhizobium macuxiense]|uniref:Peptidase S8/S53 domain-containing protein n=1 Tax=Bradyrhizobium macuxiense TaxID=1755647 RepID=A0A120FS19_9BRAD|nr:hypothetical protein [Bradyrhizobium macuxiense]KWV61010.1 hypothetical protein AS156_26785 [Bradyrhizobium macuxiense]
MPKYDLPRCFGPYLRYAISANFRNFEFFDEKKRHKLFFLVEFKQADMAVAFRSKMKRAGFHVEAGPALDGTRYATLRTDKAAVLNAIGLAIWDEYVSRVELSLPLKPSPMVAFTKRRISRIGPGKRPAGTLLIGMLDDGCPFAAAQFLRHTANAGLTTRVRAIWDQNQGRQQVQIRDGAGIQCLFGEPLQDFNYGLEFQRASDAPGKPARQIGLDEWIQLHSTPSGSVDEDGCYADAGFTSLKGRSSHGAHVMDVLAGRVPTSSRIGPATDRRDPPSWRSATDPASSIDVVFVQFPEICIKDATGVWLKAYVLDGIRYILSHADPNKTERVIVNLSYGPTTGPHDGTSELEAALAALVSEFNGANGKPKLEIVLAAGNSYLSEGHVALTRDDSRPNHIEWTWRLPPDNSVLCFAEVWMKTADAGGVVVTLTSPSGAVYAPAPPLSSGLTSVPVAPAGVDVPIVWGDDTMWRLQVEPTVVAPKIAAAEHGDWTIKVAGIRAAAELHAFVARTDPNMGVAPGAKLSSFVDPTWERTRSAEANCIRSEGEFDRSGSVVRRDGTLNGIATAEDAGIHVAGGYILSNGRKSTYSSAGPARSGPLTLRRGPDFVLPCDDSYALSGVRGGGNRSGSVFRLTGTSAAAPQFAREIADATPLQPTNPPGTPSEIGKRGGGNLDAP